MGLRRDVVVAEDPNRDEVAEPVAVELALTTSRWPAVTRPEDEARIGQPLERLRDARQQAGLDRLAIQLQPAEARGIEALGGTPRRWYISRQSGM